MSWLVLVGTLVTGSIYALIVIGLVVLFRATRVISFAQGGFMALGAFLFLTLAQSQPFAVALAEAVLITGVVGGLSYWILLRRLARAAHFTTVIATLGLNIVLLTVIALVWGPNERFPAKSLGNGSFSLFHGGLTFTSTDLFTVIVAFAVVLVLVLALQKSGPGVKMRAVADSPTLSSLLAVNVTLMSAIAWAISAMTAALAGTVVGLGSTFDAGTISSLGLVAFPAMILGGLDSIKGALVGGLLLAFGQTLVSIHLGGQWTQVIAYAALLAVLMLRPSGLFGSKRLERV
jgi:branched-chain amino acid transport system permease protein